MYLHEYNENDCGDKSAKESTRQDNIDEAKSEEAQGQGNKSNLWDFVTYLTTVDKRVDPMILVQKLHDFAVSYRFKGTLESWQVSWLIVQMF